MLESEAHWCLVSFCFITNSRGRNDVWILLSKRHGDKCAHKGIVEGMTLEDYNNVWFNKNKNVHIEWECWMILFVCKHIHSSMEWIIFMPLW